MSVDRYIIGADRGLGPMEEKHPEGYLVLYEDVLKLQSQIDKYREALVEISKASNCTSPFDMVDVAIEALKEEE